MFIMTLFVKQKAGNSLDVFQWVNDFHQEGKIYRILGIKVGTRNMER